VADPAPSRSRSRRAAGLASILATSLVIFRRLQPIDAPNARLR